MSDDRLEAHKAIETLIEVEIGPPVTEERMPFLIFFGADIAGEMQYALYRMRPSKYTVDLSEAGLAV
jgi:hypothetical protein